MFFTTKNNVRLFYEQTGQGKDLILIAGLATNYLIWDSLIPFLSKYFRILRFDNRGVGQTKAVDSVFSIKDMAEDVVELMDHLHIQQACIVGHSMGGAILQQLLLCAPERVNRAVICASFAKLPLIAMVHVRTSAWLRKAGVSEALILETIIPWIFGRAFIQHEKNIPQMIQTFLTNPWIQSAADYEAQTHALAQFDLREKLNQIQTKTLIVVGGQDKLTPSSCSKYLHRCLVNSELVTIKSSGHMVQIECPEELATLIHKFS